MNKQDARQTLQNLIDLNVEETQYIAVFWCNHCEAGLSDKQMIYGHYTADSHYFWVEESTDVYIVVDGVLTLMIDHTTVTDDDFCQRNVIFCALCNHSDITCFQIDDGKVTEVEGAPYSDDCTCGKCK